MDKQDSLNNKKSIYEVSAGEVFWKNFLAGFGRALGGVFVYLILITISYGLFVVYVLPHLSPYLVALERLARSMEVLSNSKSGNGFVIPNILDLQKLLGK
jgi:hypothetical protein